MEPNPPPVRQPANEAFTAVSEAVEKRDSHREEIKTRRQTIKSLESAQDFLKYFRTTVMPAAIPGQKTQGENIPGQEKLLTMAEKMGIDKELAKKVLFGDSATNQQGLVDESIAIWQSIQSEPGRRRSIGEKISQSLSVLCQNRPEFVQIISEEKIIPIRKSDGSTQYFSPRELLTAGLDNYVTKVIDIDKAAVDAYLSDPDLATYDTYSWIKEISQAVASKEIAGIFPTPYTESVEQLIETAHTKRNGLLKYILYGEAGVGKTRLIQETDRKKGKNTVVINFHHFISFEDLIGQTATTVNLGGASAVENLEKAVERFVTKPQNEGEFWQDMTNVFDGLPEDQKGQFGSVDNMVGSFGKDLGETASSQSQNRDVIRSDFQKRIKAIRDTALLGLDTGTEKDLQARWVQGAISKAINEGNVVCFDEMDKAGKYAIEGLLSFLSYSPGDAWKFQGGTIKIPSDFYITATSNSANIGGLTDSQDMNRYLADRCEQIMVKPQPVKDALMIAAVNLSNESGVLLINEEEQVHLINAFSYILPKLQEAGLSMPVTNRIIKTICSRLVDYQEMPDGKRHYFRITDQTGNPQSVADALRLSLLTMKGMSLGKDGEKKVALVLDEYLGLIQKNQIPEFGSDLLTLLTLPSQTEEERRVKVAESIWRQPLFKTIAALESDIPNTVMPRPEIVDGSSVRIDDFSNLVAKVPSLKMKILGRRNGILIEPSKEGLYMRSFSPDSALVGEKLVVQGDYSDAQITSADQLGEVFAIKKNETNHEVIVKGEILTLEPGNIPITVDPKGRYVISNKDGSLHVSRIIREGEEDGNKKYKLVEIPYDNLGEEVVDISNDGQRVIIKSKNGLQLIDLSNIQSESFTAPYPPTNLILENWQRARFLGNRLIIGLTDEEKIATDADGRTKLVKISP
jgi:MoxR-like ATPase